MLLVTACNGQVRCGHRYKTLFFLFNAGNWLLVKRGRTAGHVPSLLGCLIQNDAPIFGGQTVSGWMHDYVTVAFIIIYFIFFVLYLAAIWNLALNHK